MSTRTARIALDFAMRLAFFATAPFALVFLAALFPVTGALAQIGFALAVFFAAEAVRGLTKRSKVANWILSGQLAFDEYYREHAPRPFLYYVFYPFLFPYWLTVAKARREFLLYKGYTLASFALLVATLGWQYWSAFPPELDVRAFLPIAAGTFAIETIVVLMFLMPIVTSVVHYHTTHARTRLLALLIVGVFSSASAIVLLERARDSVVSYATRTRVRLRSKARPDSAVVAETKALHEAWNALPKERGDVDGDGKVEGLPLEKAHAALAAFYRSDEAEAFDLWFSKRGKHAVMVLYFEARDRKAPIWLAMDNTRTASHVAKDLPPRAFVQMKSAADALE